MRDLRAEISLLRSRLASSQQRQYEAEHCVDRIDQQEKLARMIHDATSGRLRGRHGHSRFRSPYHCHTRSRTRSTPRPSRRYEVIHRDGTHRSYWGYPEEAPIYGPDSSPRFYRETLDSPS